MPIENPLSQTFSYADAPAATGTVTGVFTNARHDFSKRSGTRIRLVEGLGIEGDAHYGERVQHLFDARRDPKRPNYRQVHLMAAELIEELTAKGYTVAPGQLGENIATRGIDLIGLPLGTRLVIGAALVQITGVRSCCVQIDTFSPGMLKELVVKRDGKLVRRGGVMGVILTGGEVAPGDTIAVFPPAGAAIDLEVV